MWTAILLGLIMLICLGLVWVLTLTETALGYISRRQAEAIVDEHPNNPVLTILDAFDQHLLAVRFWRVFLQTAAAVFLTMLIDFFVNQLWLTVLFATLAMLVIAGALTLFSPRDLAEKYESTSVRLTARLVRVLTILVAPLIAGYDSRQDDDDEDDEETSEIRDRHFKEFIDRARANEVIEDSEADMIRSVVDLDDTLVRSVMVPRTDMVWLESGTPLSEATDIFIRSGNSRIPVMGENPDDVEGIVYLKDIVRAMHRTEVNPQATPVEAVSRAVYFVPESKSVWSLLQEMQRDAIHIALVVDEYGGTAGLVTLEDLIEEVVGDISDEYDAADTAEVTPVGSGEFLVSASMSVSDFAETFALTMEDDDDVDTVGGLLTKSLGKIPLEDSETQIENLRMRVESLENRRNRVDTVRVWILDKDEHDTADDNHGTTDRNGSKERKGSEDD